MQWVQCPPLRCLVRSAGVQLCTWRACAVCMWCDHLSVRVCALSVRELLHSLQQWCHRAQARAACAPAIALRCLGLLCVNAPCRGLRRRLRRTGCAGVALGQDAERQLLRACARFWQPAPCAVTAGVAVCERAYPRPAAQCRRAEVAGAVWHVQASSAPAPAACVLLRAQPLRCLLYASAPVCDPRLCAAARKMHVLCGTPAIQQPVSRAVAAQHLEGVTPGKLL
jgi:hypothetical protein